MFFAILLVAAASSARGQDCPARWKPLDLAELPEPRGWHSMVYDRSRGCIVLFGGQDQTQRFGDTWEFRNGAWERRCAECGPVARQAFGLAYDEERHRTVLFGGNTRNDGAGEANLDDTWEWDGSSWIGPFFPESRPSRRSQTMMTYDHTRRRVVLFGGAVSDGSIASDTWEWDGTAWERRSTGGPGRYNASMCSEPALGVILVGGTPGQHETWRWDGAQWTQGSGGPPPRYSASLVDRAEVNRLVLHGGTNLASDTWELDTSGWHEVLTAGPPARYAAAMAYDESANRVLLFGGSELGNVFRGDMWEFGDFPFMTDLNGDCHVDPDDLGDFINCFFAAPPCALADINGDGNIDPDDLGDFINAYFEEQR
ncbi:MAG: kelch repeat-containing protein [Phycisphaerales bacterium]